MNKMYQHLVELVHNWNSCNLAKGIWKSGQWKGKKMVMENNPVAPDPLE